MQETTITKFFFDSVEVLDDFNLANNSWIKVLSSFNKETTYKLITKSGMVKNTHWIYIQGKVKILLLHYLNEIWNSDLQLWHHPLL